MDHDDVYAGLAGRFYSFYIARPPVGRMVGRLLWGSDFSALYRSLDDLAGMSAGAVVVDVACGAGLALGRLDPEVRYVGLDNSPSMIARARRLAHRRRFGNLELLLADVHSLPVPDRFADVCLLYNGLQGFLRPAAVVSEAARCLRPGGELRGTMLVRGRVPRADRLMDREAAREGGTMGPGGTVDELERWLIGARLDQVEISTAGALAAFTARRREDA